MLDEIEKQKQSFNKENFERIKKKVYGSYVVEYNDVSNIARMLLSDYFKDVNSLDYIEQYKGVTEEFTKQILNEVFAEKKCVLSVIKTK